METEQHSERPLLSCDTRAQSRSSEGRVGGLECTMSALNASLLDCYPTGGG